MKNYCFRASRYQNGFTLIELITVLVILGIVAAIGSSFIISTIDSYDEVQSRSKLVNRGRLVIEQMTRWIRIASPNSVRVSTSGNCVEFLPIVTGVTYLSDVPDQNNLSPAATSVATAPYSLGVGSANHVLVGALDSSEIYTAGSPAGRAPIGTLGAGPSYTAIPLAAAHRFDRNSINRRVYIADNPRRFCLIGTTLSQFSNYGLLTSALVDTDPGGDTDIMAENVGTGSQAFLLSQGIEEINTALNISLDFTLGSQQITLTQKILVRNVP